MLGKLLKYEFRATAPIFGLMYAALFVIAAINAGVMALESSLNSIVFTTIISITMVLYVIATVAVIIATLIFLAVRFYRMLGNEGYLWFTLPVTANQHVLSKLITAFVWTTASFIALFISIGILTLRLGWAGSLAELPQLWNFMASSGISPGVWIACITILYIIGLLSGVFSLYAAIAIGPNLTKSRLGGTVLAYLIIYIIGQIVSTLVLVILIIPLNGQIQTLLTAANYVNTTAIISASNSLIVWLTVGFSILYVVMAAVLYLITNFFMSRKLNLT